MTVHYSFETQKILDDFLVQLEQSGDLDAHLLHKLRHMVQKGNLGKSVEIRKLVQLLQDKHHVA